MWYVLLFTDAFWVEECWLDIHIGFEPQIHRNMEAYMDDIVVKTKDKAMLV